MCSHPGAIYMYISIIFKRLLLWNRLANQSQILCEASIEWGNQCVYINNLGHMTKMAAMPIYDKNPSKIFFSETNRLISRKLGMKHRWLNYSNVYINHDPVMTLTKFMARSTWVAYAFELGKLLKCHLKGKASRKLANGQNIEDSEKRKWPKGFICPCTGVKYHNIQTCLLVYAADLRWAFTGPLVLWFGFSFR